MPDIGSMPAAALHAVEIGVRAAHGSGQWPEFSTKPWRAASRTACRAEMESANQMP